MVVQKTRAPRRLASRSILPRVARPHSRRSAAPIFAKNGRRKRVASSAGLRIAPSPPNRAKYSMWLAAEPGILHPPQVVRAVDPDRDSLDLVV